MFGCRYVVGTLDLMVAENYVIVYFCAGGQKDKLPGISWLRECYTTIDRRYAHTHTQTLTCARTHTHAASRVCVFAG